MRLLKTYMQISDLHFTGDLHAEFFDPWAQHVPGLRGLVGHSAPVLRFLQSAFTRLSRAEPGTELIVTGDLTAFGSPSQFRAADAYLGGVTPRFGMGLNQPEWARLSVPGNHDFWSGIACVGWGATNREVRKRYPHDAWVTPALTLPNGRALVFLHLNGDADVKALSPERMYACGSFRSAIRKLDTLLGQRPRGELRVLLLHHSVQHEGEPIVNLAGSRWLPFEAKMLLKHLSINDESRVGLAALIANHDVRLVLTGHVHHPPFLGRITAGAFADGPACWESCCGSTTQRCSAASPEFYSDNALIVHRLIQDGSEEILWHSETHGLLFGLDRRPEFRRLSSPLDQTLSIRLSP